MLPPMAGSKRLVHWTSETWWKCEKCRSSTGLPSNRYRPYGILAVCHHNLWPAVRTELGQEEWIRSLWKPQAKRTYHSWWSGIMSGSWPGAQKSIVFNCALTTVYVFLNKYLGNHCIFRHFFLKFALLLQNLEDIKKSKFLGHVWPIWPVYTSLG